MNFLLSNNPVLHTFVIVFALSCHPITRPDFIPSLSIPEHVFTRYRVDKLFILAQSQICCKLCPEEAFIH